MTNQPGFPFDPFWEGYFARQIAAGISTEKILSSVSMLNLQGAKQTVDLTLCTRMPRLRDLIAPMTGVSVTGKDMIPAIPALRELVIYQGSFSAADIPVVTNSPKLSMLHINGIGLGPASLAPLNSAPKLKQLTLHRVTGVTAEDLAQLTHITQLRLSDCDIPDLSALTRMPKLRSLELSKIAPRNLDFLAAPKLVSFTCDELATDESGLSNLASKAQLHTLRYPLSDLSVVANCTKLTSLVVNGSQPLDFASVRHLPITGAIVHFAPSEQTAEAILAQAKEVWPGLRFTGYREDWTSS